MKWSSISCVCYLGELISRNKVIQLENYSGVQNKELFLFSEPQEMFPA